MRKAFYLSVALIICGLINCIRKEARNTKVELWKLDFDSSKIDYFDRRNGRLSRAFRFVNDSIVDTKTPYFRITKKDKPTGWKDSDYSFLGTETKYFFKNDSLFTYHKTRSKWVNEGMFKKTSINTFKLIKEDESRDYKKVDYSISSEPLFDKIAFSSSFCFGSCPSLSIIIDKYGYVIFHGKYYTDSLGVFEARITAEEFEKIERSFRLTNPMELKSNYDGDWTDGFFNSVNFLKENKILKSVSDYDEIGPDEWVWACWDVKNLYQKLKLKRIYRSKLPYFLNYEFVRFIDSNHKGFRFDNFLLWSLLREGKIVDKAFNEKFTVQFFEQKIPENNVESQSEIILTRELKKVTTNGRYFKFIDNSNLVTVIDLGFNFIEVNPISK